MNKSTNIDEQDIIDLYLSGKCMKDISIILNLSYNFIRNILIKNNITRRSLREISTSKYGDVGWTGYKEIAGTRWSNIKCGAKNRNLEFSISIEYVWDLFLKQNRKCKLTGLELKFGKDFTASLDRIDSSKGYIEGNIQWVHRYINLMKSDLNNEYFISMCKKINLYQSYKDN